MNKNNVEITLALKRYRRKLRSKLKQKNKRKYSRLQREAVKKIFNKEVISFYDIIEKWLPPTLLYLTQCKKSIFYIDNLLNNVAKNGGRHKVPENFSLIDHEVECFKFLQEITASLIFQPYQVLIIDYEGCKKVDVGAQVLLDIILKDAIVFLKKCTRYSQTKPFLKQIKGVGINDLDIQKLLFSVGSPSIILNRSKQFIDIIPYKLCIHDRTMHRNPIKIREQKDLDTTRLVDYVLDSLKRLNRKLTPYKIDDLSTVIGEILINAEEHSTTSHRFSIGYFHEKNINGNHYGVLRLAILNFGKTIYEKFSDPKCPNRNSVEKMKDLSRQYALKNFFRRKHFEEETLWTLYALQEGITSVDSTRYKKRGNGSIQFIESFFNICGRQQYYDDISRMAIISGNAKIIFDGTYNIVSGIVEGEEYKFMTFNNTGQIEDMPDPKFVKFAENYFPGTIISAKILFNEDDFTTNGNL